MRRSNIQPTDLKSKKSQKEQNSEQVFRKVLSDNHLVEAAIATINELLCRFQKTIQSMSEEEAIATAKKVLQPVKKFINALPMEKGKEILFLWLLQNEKARTDVDTKISSLKPNLNQLDRSIKQIDSL
ncbi:hypothetical protein [Nostoc sp. FACHB-280]|uniref:hypothetical protein n=1 Tax=Nostoc sp. FACHB-280 TaxID=2692839 RepID=UPI00168B9590|nr:hypothetical protein [Nostoc sp. FACHB-280]MBD2498422.1 hypothetical protein [Nostoc sp. FACHB-280]